MRKLLSIIICALWTQFALCDCDSHNPCDNYARLCDRPDSGHKCVASGDSYRCECGPGHVNLDSRTCVPLKFNVSIHLLHVDNGSIYFHDVAQPETLLFADHTLNDGRPNAIDYNYDKNYIVWITYANKTSTVYAAKLFRNRNSLIKSKGPIVLHTHADRLYLRLAVDWITDRVYLTSNRRVVVLDVNNPGKVEDVWVVKPDLAIFYANHVAVFPQHQFAFWTWRAAGQSIIVDRGCTDGLRRSVVYQSMSDEKEQIILAVAADQVTNYLHMLLTTPDFANFTITTINFDGAIINSFDFPHSTNLYSSFIAFDVLGDDLYLAVNGTLHAINKHGLERETRVIEAMTHVHSRVKLVHPAMQPNTVSYENEYCDIFF